MTKRPYLYHVTELKNFNSIMSKGLIPGHSKSNLVGGAKEDYNKVIWLDSHPMVWKWAKQYFVGKNWILLKINTKHLNQKLIRKTTAHFYVYYATIPPKAITRLIVKEILNGMEVTGYYRKVK